MLGPRTAAAMDETAARVEVMSWDDSAVVGLAPRARQLTGMAGAGGLTWLVNRSRWPCVVVPWRSRLRRPVAGWGFLAMPLITGPALLTSQDFGLALRAAFGLVLVMAVLSGLPVRV
jgi:hypothetical protein